jgi:hypothetical protein
MMFRNHRRAALLPGSTLLLYPLVHYVVQFEARYRYPIFWATFLAAGYAVIEVVRWLGKAPQAKREHSQSAGRNGGRVEAIGVQELGSPAALRHSVLIRMLKSPADCAPCRGFLDCDVPP